MICEPKWSMLDSGSKSKREAHSSSSCRTRSLGDDRGERERKSGAADVITA